MLVRISAELTTPRPERDCDGIFTVVVELNDMALPGYETGRCVLNIDDGVDYEQLEANGIGR